MEGPSRFVIMLRRVSGRTGLRGAVVLAAFLFLMASPARAGAG